MTDQQDMWFGQEVVLRHVSEGTIGRHVPGSDRVRVEMAGGRVVWRPYHEQQWVSQDDASMRPISPAQLARIAFEADRALCMVTGHHKEGRATWDTLFEGDRASWIESGPQGVSEIRSELYRAIRSVLRRLELRSG